MIIPITAAVANAIKDKTLVTVNPKARKFFLVVIELQSTGAIFS